MKSRILIAAVVWVVLILIASLSYRFFFVPKIEAEKKEQTLKQTTSDSRYKYNINFSLDSFSGYAIFRSEEFREELASEEIKLNLIDDGADYNKRISSLKSGEVDLAAFPVDALISTTDSSFPAAIIALADETRGADAILSYKDVYANIDAINSKETKLVLTANSPSETLARVLISNFGLRNLDQNSFIKLKDAQAVYKKYRESKPTDKLAFVLWEPYVSKTLENPNVQVLVDSSKFRGYIVDSIVANRDFLAKNKELAKRFLKAYFRACFYFSQENRIAELISSDARNQEQPLSDAQVKKIQEGIWWKNTTENFAHFGSTPRSEKHLQHVEDIIANITSVLLKTGAISKDVSNGDFNKFYYNEILNSLHAENFHPGVEEINGNKELPVLNEEQWNKLFYIGTLDIPKIVFARSRSDLTDGSKTVLTELLKQLESWHQYYILVEANVSTIGGNIEQNSELSRKRAENVKSFLVENGLSENRIKVVLGATGVETSVSFKLGYVNY